MVISVLKNLIKEHRLALVLALICTLVHALPLLRHTASSSDGVYFPYFQGDELSYSVIIQRPSPGDNEPFLYEHRNDEFPYPSLPFKVAGWFSRMLGAHLFFTLFDFALTSVIFFIVYILGLTLLQNDRSRACVFATGVCLLYGFVSHLATALSNMPFVHAMKYMNPLLTGYSNTGWEISRIPFPLFSLPIYVLCLIFLFMSFRGGKKPAIFLCLSLPVLFYFRFYDWAFCLGMGVCLSAALLYRKKYVELRNLGVSMAVSLVLTLPGIISMFDMLARYPDTFSRANVIETRCLFPEQVYTGALFPIVLVPLVVLTLKGNGDFKIFAVSITVAYLLVSRSNLVIGKSPGPIHWEYYNLGPFLPAILSVTALSFKWKVSGSMFARYLVLACIISYSAFRFYFAGLQLEETPELYKEVAEHSKVIADGKDCVVFGPLGFIENNEAMYNFLPAHATFCCATNDELMQRYLMICKLFAVPSSHIESFLRDKNCDRLYRFAVCPSKKMEDELRNDPSRWLNYYSALPEDPDELLAVIRTRYKLDYVISFPYFQDIGSLDNLKRSKKFQVIFSTKNVTTFRCMD